MVDAVGDGAAPPSPDHFSATGRKEVSSPTRSTSSIRNITRGNDSNGGIRLWPRGNGRIGSEKWHAKGAEPQEQDRRRWRREESVSAGAATENSSGDDFSRRNAVAGAAMVMRKDSSMVVRKESVMVVRREESAMVWNLKDDHEQQQQQEMVRIAAAAESREEVGNPSSDFWGDVFRSGKSGAGHEFGRFRNWVLRGGAHFVQSMEQERIQSLSTLTNCSNFWGGFWSGPGFVGGNEFGTLRSRALGEEEEAAAVEEDEREAEGWRRRRHRRNGNGENRLLCFASRSLQASSSGRNLGFLASTAATLGEVRLRRSGMADGTSSSSNTDSSLSVDELLRHPIAIVSLVPRDVSLFLAGALAGAAAKTVTAPLDRVKLLMQVHGVRAAQAGIKSSIGFMEAIMKIGTEEGVKGYWKGNLPQVIRVIPYSAVQLLAYETYKKILKGDNAELSVGRRLVAGACAGMTSTLVTYPLDTLRLRMAVDPTSKTMSQVIVNMMKHEGLSSFYCGLGPSLLGIAPYIALNFCVFDLVKNSLPEEVRKRPEASLLTALASATFATAMCYPLDTVRRQLQMKGTPFKSVADAIPGIIARDGFLGLYRGFLPNALKNLPSSSIRLTTFDAAKNLISASQAEYDRLLNRRLKSSDPSRGGEIENVRRD
ncbi:unnamed protein product [Calypogeia fissa]